MMNVADVMPGFLALLRLVDLDREVLLTRPSA